MTANHRYCISNAIQLAAATAVNLVILFLSHSVYHHHHHSLQQSIYFYTVATKLIKVVQTGKTEKEDDAE